MRRASTDPANAAVPPRLRAAWPALAWGCRWLGLGLALGALTDALVRFVA